MKSKLIIGIALISMMVFSSCAKLPQTEIDAAIVAIDSAKVAGADVYVPEVYLALTDSMKAVDQAVQTDKAKWFPTYKSTKAKLAVVNQMTKDAIVKTEARKVELKNETDTLIVEVKALVESNKVLIAKAPRGKEGKSALVAIQSDLDLVTTSVTESETLLVSGDIIGANNKVKAAKEKAVAIQTELETAIGKVK